MEDWLKFGNLENKFFSHDTVLYSHVYAKRMQEIIREFCFLKSNKPHFSKRIKEWQKFIEVSFLRESKSWLQVHFPNQEAENFFRKILNLRSRKKVFPLANYFYNLVLKTLPLYIFLKKILVSYVISNAVT